MNEVLLSNSVIIFLLSESILFVLLFVAFIVSLRILLQWDFERFTPLQFRLESQSYLVTTIIIFVFILKFLLIFYFIFTLDALSPLVVGAMCGAGVISANDYGTPLLILKLFLLFFLTLWLRVHFYDMRTRNHQWFKEKSSLFIFIFLLIVPELILDFGYFSAIDTHLPVSCCSVLFGQLEGANPLPFGLSVSWLLVLFYLLFILVLLTQKSQNTLLFIAVLSLFVAISYYAVVYFFGTYIYQLPTHKCPFCMLQSDYFYVGYLLWGSLFGGVYMGLSEAITRLWLHQHHPKAQKTTRILLIFFVLLCTTYVVVYYFKTGLFL